MTAPMVVMRSLTKGAALGRVLLVLVLAGVLAAGWTPVAARADAGSTGIVVDSFDGDVLDPAWSLEHPHGTARVNLAQGRLAIELPEGPSSDATGENTSARVMRATTGLESVDAKFDSVPAERYQDVGLQIRESQENWLRFGLYSDGSARFLYYAHTQAGESTVVATKRIAVDGPFWLGLVAVGTGWEARWSLDAETWQAIGTADVVLPAGEAGVYAGAIRPARTSPAPQWTAVVDEFRFAAQEPAAPSQDPTDPSAEPTEPSPTDPSAEPTEPSPTDPSAEPTEPSPTDPSAEPTEPSGAASALVSDDFSGGSLGEQWEVVDPVGGASVGLSGGGTQDARLVISLPGGLSRDAFHANGSTRVLQRVADEAFAVESKFDSVPSEKYQDQGLLVEQDEDRWLRFSVYSDGRKLYAYGASTTGGVTTEVLKSVMTASSAVWLRVVREGDVFTFSTSVDGASWQAVGEIEADMVVTAVGPYAGVAGTFPAWAAQVDYVFSSDSPVEPEDGGSPPDTDPPAISVTEVTAGSSSVRVSWSTDEVSTGAVEVASPGTGVWTHEAVTDQAGEAHTVLVQGLASESAYDLRVTASDLEGNAATRELGSFTTTASNGPVIDLWYGLQQEFGHRGRAQSDANILGNVSDGDGVASLRYSVNGGDYHELSVGPDLRRLQKPGDFNIDLALHDLVPGPNAVTIVAEDGVGDRSDVSLTVTRTDVAAPGLPYLVDWTLDAPVAERAWVVDGKWQATEDGVRVAAGATGYDRIIALGDQTWTDYEVTVPFTVHELGPDGGAYPSGAPLIGVGLRWQGHGASGAAQPKWRYEHVGAYAWYRWYDSPTFELLGDGAYVKDREPMALELGEDYVLTARVRTEGEQASYEASIHPAGEAVPTEHQVTYQGAGPTTGSIALLAHHVDATFGDVSVTPLDGAGG